MNILSKEQLLSAPILAIKEVEISIGTVLVREMTGYEKDVWEQSLMRQAPQGNKDGVTKMNLNLENFRAKLAVCTMCDESGKLLFNMNDMITLSKALKASDMEKIVEAAQEINGISDKDKDEMLKNSEADPEESSNSSSAEN